VPLPTAGMRMPMQPSDKLSTRAWRSSSRTDTAAPPREIRLKPEFAAIYEGVEPGVWLPARVLAEQVIARVHKQRALGVYSRTFDSRHFEFRGGEQSGKRLLDVRTRSSDETEDEK
jgi:hypothetical protein